MVLLNLRAESSSDHPEPLVLWPGFGMTVRLTALVGTLESCGLPAIAITEPDAKRARQDSNL